ncbi:MAG: hypothetical protein K9N62_00945 [Verrucomicrobia bacterium]|nr:hypothetical protein [Verrucomicrobiota bacterium]
MAVMVAATNAWANNLHIDRVSGYYEGIGGEFTVTPNDLGDLNGSVADYHPKATHTYTSGGLAGRTGIQTFCIEYHEHVSIPEDYHYDLGPNAIKGGTLAGDPVSAGAGYLYNRFARGILSGYNYVVGTARKNSANDLQKAIWWLEGELSLSASMIAANPFLNQVALVFGSATASKASFAFVGSEMVSASYYGVGAINMGPDPLYPNQDQLYWKRLNDSHVPEGAATLILIAMSMTGLTWVPGRARRAS